jgi:ribonuclease P protein component
VIVPVANPPERLRASSDVVATLRRGEHRAGRLVAVHVRRQDEPGPPRLTVVASKKVGAAVSRNRAKRLLREAARQVAWQRGLDIVLVARPAAAIASADDVVSDVARLAAELGAADVI